MTHILFGESLLMERRKANKFEASCSLFLISTIVMEKKRKMGHKNLHITFIINVSSKAEFGSLGLDPSHLSFVPSSDGEGRKVSIELTMLLFVEFEI